MKHVLILGAGISGLGAAHVLLRHGAHVVISDLKDQIQNNKEKEELIGLGAEFCFGAQSESLLDGMDAVVVSPVIPAENVVIQGAMKRHIPVLSEVELAYRVTKAPILAITGTNGKTTTTTLLGSMLSHSGRPFALAGNLGISLSREAELVPENGLIAAEVSSFQLEFITHFRPKAAVILNITPDHLERHHTMEAYVAAKEAVASHQTKNDICVLNYDNDYTRDFAGRCPATPVLFSSHHELKNGYFLRGDKIIKSVNGEETELMDIHKDMNLVGLCNVENVMAAIAIAEGMQVPMETILTVIRGFHAVEHRIEFVATKGGVDYYNDSKGTNPDAAIQGIKAMSKPTVLIGGGYDKQSEYDEWIDSFDGKVKCLVLIGQTREKIAECARKHGFDKIRFADTYEECLKLCTELAQPGEAVLLSPACASWGMFPNYEVRGQLFKEYVHGLAE